MIPDIHSRLRHFRERGLWRKRILAPRRGDAPQEKQVKNDRLSFISNDYLDLSTHPQVSEALARTARVYGHGSSGSALLGGYHAVAMELETEVAAWLGRDAAVLLGSGFMANLAVGGSVLGRCTLPGRSSGATPAHWLTDHNAHASIVDATRLSGWPVKRFGHNDMQDLDRRLHTLAQHEMAIYTEGLFSMDADIPDWNKLCAAAAGRAAVIVDEAHSFGVLGCGGRGASAHCSQDDIALVVLPLGKAIGGYGALVCGQHDYVDAIIEFGRSYIYSTALPPAVVAADLAAVRLLPELDEQREHLRDNIAYLRQCLAQNSLQVRGDAHSPIQLIDCTTNDEATAVGAYLRSVGVLAGAVRAPTVSRPRIRISLRAGHQHGDIDVLVKHLTAPACPWHIQ